MRACHSVIPLSLLLLIAQCGCSNGTAKIGGAATPSSNPGDSLPRVQTVRPEQTTLQRTTTQPVTVIPYHEARIDAKVSGYLHELKVDIGDSVAQGDVLAVLHVPEMVNEVDEQQAVIERLHAEQKQADAAVELAAANVAASQASLAQTQSETQSADADLKAQQAEFRRIEDLVGRQSVAARMQDETRQRLDSAKAARSAAQAAVTTAEANVEVARAKLDAAKAEVERASAETTIAVKRLEKMQTLLKYATLTAPFDGVITSRSVDLGDLVSNSQAANGKRIPLLTLSQLDKVRVQAAIPEDDAPWTTLGDNATVRLTALRGQSFPGTVSRTTNSLDSSTRTMLAEIDLDNPDRHLLPGMYGEASFILDEKAGALVLPASAVRFDAEGKAHVYKVSSDGTIEVVDVTTGVDDGHRIEITSGLSAEDVVVDGMLDRLATGQQVQIDD